MTKQSDTDQVGESGVSQSWKRHLSNTSSEERYNNTLDTMSYGIKNIIPQNDNDVIMRPHNDICCHNDAAISSYLDIIATYGQIVEDIPRHKTLDTMSCHEKHT